LVGILKSFLGSCQHALSNFVCTDMWILLQRNETERKQNKAVSTSETSDTFYETAQRNIPGGCSLHTRRRDNLK
jgi:hypothetical protein